MTFLRHIYLAYQVKKTSVVSQYLLLFRMLFNRERPPYGHGANDALKVRSYYHSILLSSEVANMSLEP
jgi:hypothetical protein